LAPRKAVFATFGFRIRFGFRDSDFGFHPGFVSCNLPADVREEDTMPIDGYLDSHIQVVQAMRAQAALLEAIAAKIVDTLRKGGKLLLCGNGGSAADAQHVAAEFVGRYRRNRRALAAIALTTDTSILTAVGNDFDYADVFSRQVEALAKPGDLVIGISTSGKSPNVIKALEAARRLGAATLAFTRAGGEPLVSLADQAFAAPSQDTPRVQEAHILAWHIICELVEAALAEK
jgi:D-sedoheptulose 7-phosphate isomerase